MSGALVPYWFSIPLGLAAMLITAAHLIAMRSPSLRMPASRRRIRSVNGGIMLALCPLLVVAFSFTSRAEPVMFLRVWTAATGLLAIVVVLAGVDMLNSARLGREAIREARAEFRRELARARGEIAAARAASSDERGPALRFVDADPADDADHRGDAHGRGSAPDQYAPDQPDG